MFWYALYVVIYSDKMPKRSLILLFGNLVKYIHHQHSSWCVRSKILCISNNIKMYVQVTVVERPSFPLVSGILVKHIITAMINFRLWLHEQLNMYCCIGNYFWQVGEKNNRLTLEAPLLLKKSWSKTAPSVSSLSESSDFRKWIDAQTRHKNFYQPYL